ncbi:ATP-binding protein [Roseomonas sp. WA12]
MSASPGRTGESDAFSFGPFLLLPRRQLLLADGRPVRLGGRAFELLRVMVERHGEVVTREELIAAAWPKIYVHESNLKVNIASLRRALGDDDDAPRFVATVPRRGYRFVAPVTASTAPELDRLAAPPPSPVVLPPPRGIIGRAQEISALIKLLEKEREVTVVGAGGVGKTALAIEVAQAIGPSFPAGVCFVDLSPVDDPTSLPASLLQALGLPGNPADPLAAVVGHLRANRTLVLLDNCEHLQPAAAILTGKFLAAGGESRLLATSRFPLGAALETIFPVEPLQYAVDDRALNAEQAMRFPAIEMLVRRSAELTGYRLADGDCSSLARICRALDGLPLAIELAAAELGIQGPHRLRAKLDLRLTALRSTEGAVPSRHRTLQATIDWSYGLLSANEAILFRVISVFPDRFDQEDAVAVATAAGLGVAAVVGCLGSLLAKSLLTAGMEGACLGFRMFDSTRLYAGERRRGDPLDRRIQRFHAQRVLALFDRSEGEWDWRESREWLPRYRERLPDLRVALTWAFCDGNDPGLGVRLTAAALPLWFELSAMAEGRRWTGAALRYARTAPCNDVALAKLADFHAWVLVYDARPVAEVEEAWRAAVAAAERAGQTGQHLRALAALALYLVQTGQIGPALACLEEFRALSRATGDRSAAPEGERALALARSYSGDLRRSRMILDRLAAAHPRPDRRPWMAGFRADRYLGIRCDLPMVAWLTGQPDRAAATARDAVELAGTLNHLVSQSNALGLAALPVALCRRDASGLERYTAQLRANLETEHLGIWVPVERFYAAALAEMREEPGSVVALRQAIAGLASSGNCMLTGMSLSVLAEALVRQHRLDEAAAAISDALRYQGRHDQRWCRPELLRIQAMVLRRTGQGGRADALLRHALGEARRMGAAAYGLRVANDIAAQAIDDGRHVDATAVLSPIYRRFSEGFATHDLVEARRLLERAEAPKSEPKGKEIASG